MSGKSISVVFFSVIAVFAAAGYCQYQVEDLNRGVVAVSRDNGGVYIGWRMLGTDPEDIAFNVYRDGSRINDQPLTESTNFIDPSGDSDSVYFVSTVIDGSEGRKSSPVKVWAKNYLTVPLRTLDGYKPNDASVGDLDGDGEYEIVLKQEKRPRDNSQSGVTGQTKLEAYELDGTFMWRIDLGINIREGAHYTPFIVYDLDGNGKAEVACRTAPGTRDGNGDNVILPGDDPDADYRNEEGYILEGPEYLTVFDGTTGEELATTSYIPPRGNVGEWGDSYGNRVDRFLASVAYLDGRKPSLVMCRGYYTRAVLAAWNYRDRQLSHIWTFDSDDGTPGNKKYRGQGNHDVTAVDVDGDGKDEIIYGACVIDDNEQGLYSTGLGHGDARHISDIDPERKGLEIFAIHEHPRHPYAANLRDARTGEVIWGLKARDVGRGVAFDIDPRYKGYECWASLSEEFENDGLYTCTGEKITESKPSSCNMGIWWDGDVLRELLDGVTISKWDYKNYTTERLLKAEECLSNNGTKANPCLCADILGDWREEVLWRTKDNKHLRVYTTTIPTDRRLYTFMHNRAYRIGIACQNVGYNQPAHPDFYMGKEMEKPPRPSIVTTSD